VHRHAHRHRSTASGERDVDGRPGGSIGPRAASPTDLATLLRLADGGTRSRLAREVQSREGNRGLIRLLGRGTRVHGLPAHLRAGVAADVLRDLADETVDPTRADQDDQGVQPPAPASSGTTISMNETTFNVSGTFVAMANDLAARSEAGSVISRVSDIYLFPTSDPVTLTNVTVSETRSLPRWVDRGDPNAAQVAEWERFLGALSAHEQSHIDIDKQTFADVHAKALGVSHAKANERIDSTIAAADAANQDFDSSTDHGRNAGTKIDTNAGASTQKVVP